MRQRYARCLSGQYAAAGIDPPVSGPSVYKRIARATLDSHGLDPLSEPQELARAEGIHVAFGWTPGRHGVQYDDVVIVSPLGDPLETALSICHERAHIALAKYGAPHHTEADAIFLTVELAFPSWLRDREPEFCPRWLRAICLAARKR